MSQPGMGPVRPGPDGSADGAAVPVPAAGVDGRPEPTPAERRRVLVVDGDRRAGETVSLILDRLGYWVEMEVDGNEALRKVTEGDYDVVVVDAHLPHGRGFHVCERVRCRDRMVGRRTHIILTSAGDTLEARVQAKVRGVTTVLPKPFRMGDLRHAIEAGLSRPPPQ